MSGPMPIMDLSVPMTPPIVDTAASPVSSEETDPSAKPGKADGAAANATGEKCDDAIATQPMTGGGN